MEEFKPMLADPLTEHQHGGKGGGAAKLTPFGADLLRQYRDMEAKALSVFAKPLAAVEKHLAPKEAVNPKPAKKAGQSART